LAAFAVAGDGGSVSCNLTAEHRARPAPQPSGGVVASENSVSWRPAGASSRALRSSHGDPDVSGDTPSNLHAIDEFGLRRIGDLERGPTGVQDDHLAVR
jgi:hypothetical protein